MFYLLIRLVATSGPLTAKRSLKSSILRIRPWLFGAVSTTPHHVMPWPRLSPPKALRPPTVTRFARERPRRGTRRHALAPSQVFSVAKALAFKRFEGNRKKPSPWIGHERIEFGDGRNVKHIDLWQDEDTCEHTACTPAASNRSRSACEKDACHRKPCEMMLCGLSVLV